MKPLHRSLSAVLLTGIMLAASAQTPAQPAEQPVSPTEKRNWFDDPFFQVASGLPGCPVPEGPMMTFEEQRREAHWRVERGTSCWLAGKCKDSNSYRYDKSLAAPVRAALTAVPGLQTGSVWVIIQRRIVFLQGCVASAAQIRQLEDATKAVPDVEAVVPMLDVGTAEKPRYAVQAAPN